MRLSHGITSLKDVDFKKAKETMNSAPFKWKDRKTKDVVTGIQILHPSGFRIPLPSVRVIDNVVEKHMVPEKKKVTREILKDGKIVKVPGVITIRKRKDIKIKRPRIVSHGGTVVGKQGDWLLQRKDGSVFAMKDKAWNHKTGPNNQTVIHNRFERGS